MVMFMEQKKSGVIKHGLFENLRLSKLNLLSSEIFQRATFEHRKENMDK